MRERERARERERERARERERERELDRAGWSGLAGFYRRAAADWHVRDPQNGLAGWLAGLAGWAGWLGWLAGVTGGAKQRAGIFRALRPRPAGCGPQPTRSTPASLLLENPHLR